jgi:hypothetical protein
MAYINQASKQSLAPKIKAICKKYGVKATLAIRNHSTLVLNVKSGAIDFIGNGNDTCSKDPYQAGRGFAPNTSGYEQVNPYHYGSHYSGKAKKFLQEVLAEMKGADWYDNSDAQTDYFDTAYYVDVNIGKWNQPYALSV